MIAINNMGFLLQTQGKLDEAEPYYREALTKYSRVLGKEHPDTLNSINNMGSLLTSQRKFATAEAMLIPAAAIAETRLPIGHRARLRLTRTIITLYDAWHTSEPGKGYDAKAAKWKAKLAAMTKPAEQPAPAGK